MAKYIDEAELIASCEDAMVIVEAMVTNQPEAKVMLEGMKVIYDIIKESPSADVNEHGEWIENKLNYMLYGCSECGFRNDFESDYCPRCGARMDGGIR